MDLFVRNGSAEISRPLVIRSKYDLLGEIYGNSLLESARTIYNARSMASWEYDYIV